MITLPNKGDIVRARWMRVNTMASLAGCQMKASAVDVTITGTVRHVRGDDPVAPATVGIFVDVIDGPNDLPTVRPPRCTCLAPHVLVKPEWLVTP